MAFIKRFESISMNEDIECCKDIIETIAEYEEGLELSNYTPDGYYGYEFSNQIKDEKDKRAIFFSLKPKGLVQYGNKKLKSKSDIDTIINLTQRSKSIFSKLENYCSEINFSIKNEVVSFTLIFENQDENIKRYTKVKRIFKSIESYFKDYVRSKTFSVSEKEGKYKLIISEVQKINPKVKHFEFRFTTDITLNNEIITIKPKNFRYNDEISWKTIRSNSRLSEFVSVMLIEGLKSDWVIRKDIDSLKFDVKDGSLSIEIS